jgi:hypothetical protein
MPRDLPLNTERPAGRIGHFSEEVMRLIPTLRDPTPSQEDQHITKRLREVGDLLGIRVLDHLVFGDGRYVSFVDDGYWSA